MLRRVRKGLTSHPEPLSRPTLRAGVGARLWAWVAWTWRTATAWPWYELLHPFPQQTRLYIAVSWKERHKFQFLNWNSFPFLNSNICLPQCFASNFSERALNAELRASVMVHNPGSGFLWNTCSFFRIFIYFIYLFIYHPIYLGWKEKKVKVCVSYSFYLELATCHSDVSNLKWI